MTKLPTRRKSKDNPYTLKYSENKNMYIVEFIDNKNKKQIIEISEVIYNAFDKFELEDLSQMHKYERHIEHSEIYEESLYARAIEKEISVDEYVENSIAMEKLKLAIDSLSEIQKRRIKLYFFEGLTQREIAKIENTSIIAVQYTLNNAIKNLKEILKKLNF